MDGIDTRIVKASFRECPLKDRKEFKHSHCLLPISIGQSVHEGKKFLATLKLINASFQRCTILVDDTIQWHTLKIDYPDNSKEVLYRLALLKGGFWLKQYEYAIKALEIPHNILRWNHWRTHPNFGKKFSMIEDLYGTNSRYREAINLNIADYLARHILKENFNYEQAFACCLDYLKEECAVMLLWTEGLYDFEVYPSGRNRAMAATYEYLIKPEHPQLLRPVALRFKKYPTALTQYNETNPSLISPQYYGIIES